MTLIDSTITGNSAAFAYTFIYPSCFGGGGIFNDFPGVLKVINSTIVGNSTSDCFTGGGGILNQGTLTLANNTIAGNTVSNEPDTGPGYFPVFGSGGGIINLVSGGMAIANSIVSGNTAPASNDISSVPYTYTDQGGNMIGGSPMLDALDNYGGPTETMPPQFGSPAICAGRTAKIPDGVTTDQRGFPRTTNHNGAICVDAGAVQTNY